jgi:hypothetical protein
MENWQTFAPPIRLTFCVVSVACGSVREQRDGASHDDDDGRGFEMFGDRCGMFGSSAARPSVHPSAVMAGPSRLLR